MARGGPFLQQVREAIRVRHCSRRTEDAYLGWTRHYILFHGKRHPAEMGALEVGQFLTHLAVGREVSASTQNQALNALVFLYGKVLEAPLGDIGSVVRAKTAQRLPVVLTQSEVARLMDRLRGVQWLVACLLYGCGLRLLEAMRLGVKDLDCPRRAVLVRNGKGAKDRVVTLADELVEPLRRHLENSHADGPDPHTRAPRHGDAREGVAGAGRLTTKTLACVASTSGTGSAWAFHRFIIMVLAIIDILPDEL